MLMNGDKLNYPIIRKMSDTIWSSPRYHGGAFECKIWPVVIIFKHR